MHAVLLMAGKGTRMAKYYEGPKHLLPVNGKPVIEHILESLPGEITELIFVVGGPHEETIRDHFKTGEHQGRPITFVTQAEQLGLAHAFWTAKKHVKGKWLGMVSDDLIDAAGLSKLVTHDLAVLARRVDNPENFGVLVTDEEGYVTRSIEKPKEFVSDLVWTGHMVMDEDFMTLDGQVPPSGRGEFETPDVWMKLIEQGAKIKVVESNFWLPINDKDQLEQAERVLKEQS